MALPKGIHAYCKKKLGFGAANNTSIYTLAVMALEKDGKRKPPSMDDKEWVMKNKDVFRGSHKTHIQKKPKSNPNHLDMLFSSTQWAMALLKASAMGRCVSCGETTELLYGKHKIAPKDRPDMALSGNNIRVLCTECFIKES